MVLFFKGRDVPHLHRHSVIHRDLALRNFVLSDETVLIDFGLAQNITAISTTYFDSRTLECESISTVDCSLPKNPVHKITHNSVIPVRW